VSNSPISDPTLEVLAIVDSDQTFRWMMGKQPELRALLIEAANAAGGGPAHASLIQVLTIVTSASDKSIDAFCRGDAPELAKWRYLHSAASEDLGRLLKQLVPTAVPIGEDVIAAPAN